jgi:RNA polymerase sigma-70 factor (ECF subfamily)
VDAETTRAFEAALRGGAYGAAWRYCCRLTRSLEEAEDLLQDSLAHALPRFGGLRDRMAFCAWLLAIVRTRFLSAVRARKLAVVAEGELAGRLAVQHGPDEQLVLESLCSLTPGQRECLELFYLEGLSLAELGRVLGIPAVAARHRLHRARGALRERVNHLVSPAPAGPVSAAKELP